MPDQKISVDDLVSSLKKNMSAPLVDPNEAADADKNKRATFEQILGPVVTSAASTLTLNNCPGTYVYTGAGNATWSLLSGSTDIVGFPIRVWNESAAGIITVTPDGADAFSTYASSGTSGSLDVYGGSSYILIWTGSIWIFI
jgi:hypothetical protein